VSGIKTRDGKTLPDQAFEDDRPVIPKAELDAKYSSDFLRKDEKRLQRVREQSLSKRLRQR